MQLILGRVRGRSGGE